jgi:hypothetical protein
MGTTAKICPLMSAGQNLDKICAKDVCAWYIPSLKTCAVYALGHNALLEIKVKQQESKK